MTHAKLSLAGATYAGFYQLMRFVGLIFVPFLLFGCAHQQQPPFEEGNFISSVLLGDTNAPPGSVYRTKIYVVAPKERFSEIAARFGLTVDELKRLNRKINANMLLVGQRIRVAEERVQ